MLDKEIREVIVKLKSMISDDPRRNECYDEIEALLSRDEKETIKFLKGCSEEELCKIRGVLGEVNYALVSKEYLDLLKEFNKKYPRLQLDYYVQKAEEYMITTMDLLKEAIKGKKSLPPNPDDPRVEKCDIEMYKLLAIDEKETRKILNQLSEEEIFLVKDVLPEVAYKFYNKEFIKFLEEIEKKYPKLNLREVVEAADAEVFMLDVDMKPFLDKREEIDFKDPKIKKIRERVTDLLGDHDTGEMMEYLDELSKEEILWLSELFEDIAHRFQNEYFLEYLRQLQKKYPDIDISESLKKVEEVNNYYLMVQKEYDDKHN